MEWVAKNEHIKHVIVEKNARLSALLMELFQLSEEKAKFLIHLGSIYLDKKRVRDDVLVLPRQYLRAHLYPRRWPAETIDWRKTIVDETADFLVIDKPAGIPVPSSVDNFLENACYQIAQMLGKPVYITHRLDRPTRGLFVLAKTKEFQSKFNRLLIDRKISKKYLSLSRKEVPLGLVIHYMEDTLVSPKKVIEEFKINLLKCEMIVLSSQKIVQGHASFYQHEIELLTGRTHQIRAQMAALDSPLLGDTPYGGEKIAGFQTECIGLMAYHLAFLEKKYTLPASHLSVNLDLL